MTPSILFVDDEPHILEALKRALRPKSALWNMRFVGGVDAALAALEETSYDAVITDVRMPGKSGFDLLEAILSCEETRYIPVVILTGENDHDLKRHALDLGAASDDQQALEVDDDQMSSIQGLYAAGDVVSSLNQISVAVGHGGVAATAIHRSLAANFR